jgi:hypothetical protein
MLIVVVSAFRTVKQIRSGRCMMGKRRNMIEGNGANTKIKKAVTKETSREVPRHPELLFSPLENTFSYFSVFV